MQPMETNLTRLLFAGDTHGELEHLGRLPKHFDSTPIIHLGDAAPLGGGCI